MNVFAIGFQDKQDFMNLMDTISVLKFDITDTVLGDERCIIFYSLEGFLFAINKLIENSIACKVHYINH